MLVAVIVLMFYSICKSIPAIIKFLMWSKHVHTEGVLIELKKKAAEYKSLRSDKVVSTSYLFNMRIEYDGDEYDVDFEDVTPGDNPSKYEYLINHSVPVYFDIYKKRAVSVESVKKELWIWPLIAGGCILMSILLRLAMVAIL